MKNKKILLCMISIFLVGTILTQLAKNNSKTYVMYDGAMLALSVDGTPVTSLPTDTSNYYVSIECDGGIGQYLPIQEDNNYNKKIVIKNIVKEGVKCDVDFTTINDNNKNNYLLNSIVQNNATQISSENNAGNTDISYRYTGKTPNNYIWFNNELWRIIGLIPTCTTSGCSNKSNLIKIIRNESLGGYAYDAKSSGYTGAWGSNTLYTLLNSYYYGKGNGTNDSSCRGYYSSTLTTIKQNCDYGVIGISSDESDYYGRMVKNVYWNTGASNENSTTNEVYKTETAIQTVSGKIGLMSASDYGYAGLYYDVSMYDSLFSTYTETNWLFGYGYELTNIQTSSSSDNSIIISPHGVTRGSTRGDAIRPTIYLNSDVYVISGNGTEITPYIIGI